MKFLVIYPIVLAVMGVLDFLWLGVLSKDFYRKHLGDLMLESFKWGPAISFYLLYAFGITVFIVLPILSGDFSIKRGLLLAALFGAVAYATYDLSNWATLKGWPPIVVFVDILWGIFFTTVSVYISYILAKLFG